MRFLRGIRGYFYKFIKSPLFFQVFFYGVIGCASTIINVALFFGLRKLDVNLYLANFVSINLGIAISFFANCFFNFKITTKIAARFLKFFAVGYSGLLLSTLLLFVGVELLNHTEIFIKIISIFVVGGFQFTLNKLVTFKKSAKPVQTSIAQTEAARA
jgi:putative flippase GtrA